MKYISTNGKTPKSTFKSAVVKGLAEDNGLFYPEKLHKLPPTFYNLIEKKNLQEIAFNVIRQFISNEIPEQELKKLINDTLNFKIPLVEIEKDIYSLELFHGPTLAFKDIGARFMARCLRYFVETRKNLNVLVATSGDTGSAVANGFWNIEGINIIILYPQNKVSKIQEKQLTTLGKNITALEVEGTFDDCQKLVKEAFAHKELNASLQLTSANSINIARWLPQMFYYFYAYAQLKYKKQAIAISVPSGNYGNLSAGLLAKQLGLPIQQFIAASNVNDVVPKYLQTGTYTPQPSIQTISNAMDIGAPSNFARIMEMYKHSWTNLKKDLTGYSFTDKETKKAIQSMHSKQNYLLDPHGAIGYLALKKYLTKNNCVGVFMETAHPTKFLDVVQPLIKTDIKIPDRLKDSMGKTSKIIKLKNSFDELKNILFNINSK